MVYYVLDGGVRIMMKSEYRIKLKLILLLLALLTLSANYPSDSLYDWPISLGILKRYGKRQRSNQISIKQTAGFTRAAWIGKFYHDMVFFG
jgi:hypothetical protein